MRNILLALTLCLITSFTVSAKTVAIQMATYDSYAELAANETSFMQQFRHVVWPDVQYSKSDLFVEPSGNGVRVHLLHDDMHSGALLNALHANRHFKNAIYVPGVNLGIVTNYRTALDQLRAAQTTQSTVSNTVTHPAPTTTYVTTPAPTTTYVTTPAPTTTYVTTPAPTTTYVTTPAPKTTMVTPPVYRPAVASTSVYGEPSKAPKKYTSKGVSIPRAGEPSGVYKIQLGVFEEEKTPEELAVQFGLTSWQKNNVARLLTYDFTKVKGKVCRRYFYGKYNTEFEARLGKKDLEKKTKEKLVVVKK